MSLPVLPWCGPSGSAVSVDHFAILDTNGMWIYSLSVIGGDGHQVTGWWGGGGGIARVSRGKLWYPPLSEQRSDFRVDAVPMCFIQHKLRNFWVRKISRFSAQIFFRNSLPSIPDPSDHQPPLRGRQGTMHRIVSLYVGQRIG